MKLTSLALAGALTLAAGAAAAQPAPINAPTVGPQAQGRHHGEHRDPAQMAARRAEHLRAVLQLRPDQEPALRQLISAMQPPPGAREHMRAEHRADARPLTTPERLDRMQAKLAERQARMRQRADAIRRFYAQLTPSQQQAFDALHAGHGMGEHGRHGAHGRGEGRAFG